MLKWPCPISQREINSLISSDVNRGVGRAIGGFIHLIQNYNKSGLTACSNVIVIQERSRAVWRTNVINVTDGWWRGGAGPHRARRADGTTHARSTQASRTAPGPEPRPHSWLAREDLMMSCNVMACQGKGRRGDELELCLHRDKDTNPAFHLLMLWSFTLVWIKRGKWWHLNTEDIRWGRWHTAYLHT